MQCGEVYVIYVVFDESCHTQVIEEFRKMIEGSWSSFVWGGDALVSHVVRGRSG